MTTVNYTTLGVPVHHWPRTVLPSAVTLHLRANTSTFTSPFTRTVQTSELPGALHEAEASFPPIKPAHVGTLRAFVAKLRGQAGRFYFAVNCCRYAPPAMHQAQRVTYMGLLADDTYVTADTTLHRADATRIAMETLFTVSSAPTPTTLMGALWLNSGRYPLAVGSHISWDDATGWRHLHVVVDMTGPDPATGLHTLTLEPPMRARPTPTTPMHTHAPSGIFQLTDDGQGTLRQAGQSVSFAVSMREARPITALPPA